MEKIEVGYKTLLLIRAGMSAPIPAAHKYIVYTDSDGTEFVAHVRPSP